MAVALAGPVSGSDISWAVCKSAPRSRQITTPAPHHSSFFTGRVPNQQRQSTEGILVHNAVVIGLGVVKKLCEFLTPFTVFSLLQ